MSFSSSPMNRRSALPQLALGLVGALMGRSLGAQAPAADYAAKAASLALFPDYIKWPAGVAFTAVGVLGEDPFAGALDKMNPHRARTVDELRDCQIIFVPKTESGNVETILASLGTLGILTVGESEGFVKRGGMIGFVMEEEKVRFEINPAAARRAGLGIDLRLLKLALHVINS